MFETMPPKPPAEEPRDLMLSLMVSSCVVLLLDNQLGKLNRR